MYSGQSFQLSQSLLIVRSKDTELKRTQIRGKEETRPDTRPSVADGWAGAEMRVFPLFDSMVTDRPTNGRTDKASYRVACPQLKTTELFHFNNLSFADELVTVQLELPHLRS